MKFLRYSVNGLRHLPWLWALGGGIAGVALTFALLLVGFLILAFGVYTIIVGGILGIVLGTAKGINAQRKRGLRSLVNTSDRPFY